MERAHPHRALRQARPISRRGCCAGWTSAACCSPSVVDPDTRYRYYAIGQTRVAGLIHLGRQMGLTVDQLAGLIAADRGAATCASHLARHREIVARKLAEQSRLLRLLDRELARGDGLLRYDVALKDAPAVLVVSAAARCAARRPHDPWALEAALRRVGAARGPAHRPPGRRAR